MKSKINLILLLVLASLVYVSRFGRNLLPPAAPPPLPNAGSAPSLT